jgi:anti-sigma factor RsiW
MNPCPPEAWISDYVDGRLDARERSRVDEHLATCSTCRKTVAISCSQDGRRTGEVEMVTE